MDPPIDLGLEGPGRSESITVDDEVEDGPPSLPDLSVSPAPLVCDVSPPVASASPEQEVFRRNLLEVAPARRPIPYVPTKPSFGVSFRR